MDTGRVFNVSCVPLQAGAESQWERALSFLDATAELNYMSQIVFMLFEDPSKVRQIMKGGGGGDWFKKNLSNQKKTFISSLGMGNVGRVVFVFSVGVFFFSFFLYVSF